MFLRGVRLFVRGLAGPNGAAADAETLKNLPSGVKATRVVRPVADGVHSGSRAAAGG